MMLCVDIGNSAVKSAVITGSDLSGFNRFPTVDIINSDALDDFFRVAVRSEGSLDGAVVCSVVPDATQSVLRSIKRVTGTTSELFTHESPLPFSIDVPHPERVGPDRLAAAAGALRHGGDSAIIVDAGTAITVDAVIAGRFLGGVIMAGPDLALRALHEHAILLPEIDYNGVDPNPEPGGDTHDSMVLGATHGAVGGILQAVSALEKRWSECPRKFVTGGHMRSLMPFLPAEWSASEHLLLMGLAVRTV